MLKCRIIKMWRKEKKTVKLVIHFLEINDLTCEFHGVMAINDVHAFVLCII